MAKKAADDPRLRRTADIEELDAEARAVLGRYRPKLPMWIGLYSHPTKPGPYMVWRSREGIPRGEAIPTVEGRKLQFAVTINGAGGLDPAARYVMRLWVAEHRRRQAAKRKDHNAQRAAKDLLHWLHTHPPSLDPRAHILAQANAKRDTSRAAQWRRWQKEADLIWKDHQKFSGRAVARLVKIRLSLSEHVNTIAKRISQKIAQ